jgi:predicted DNA-binding ribbon-helix-helix protein
MRSTVVKRSIAVAGRKTSISLEDAFWRDLKEIAAARRISICDLVAAVDAERRNGNLSSALRLYVLQCCRERCMDAAAGTTQRPTGTSSASGLSRPGS